MKLLSLIAIFFLLSCSSNLDNNLIEFDINKENYSSGEISVIKYKLNNSYEKAQAIITDQRGSVVEVFPETGANGTYVINRMFPNAHLYHKKDNSYFISMRFMNMDTNTVSTSYKPVSIDNSIVINSLCATQACDTISGNVVEGIEYTISGTIIGIAAQDITYRFGILEENFLKEEKLGSVTNSIYLEKIVFPSVPSNLSSYIANINIIARDGEGNIAETALPVRVVRPLDVKH